MRYLKDYIYLDRELLYSIVAQLEQGVITKSSYSTNSSKSTTTNNSEDETLSGGVSLINVLKGSMSTKESTGTSSALTDGQSEVIDNELHDSLVDLLISKHKSIFKIDLDSSNTGEFVSFGSTFKPYDFDMLSLISEANLIPKFWEDSNNHERDKQVEIYKEAGMSQNKISSYINADKKKLLPLKRL